MHTLYEWLRRRKLLSFWSRLKDNKQLVLVVVLLFAVIFLHSILFYVFERTHWKNLSYFDSFWVTMTTITTVGYGDFFAKSVGGRWSTMILGYITGLGLFAWIASELVGRLVERIELRRHGMLKINTKDHILIINFPDAQKVSQLIEQLRSTPNGAKVPLILIDSQIDSLPFHYEMLHFVRGSITDPETFKRASIQHAQAAVILAANPLDPSTDALTAAIVSTLEALKPDIKTVAECVYKKHLGLFRHVQCDNIVFTGDFSIKLLVQETQDEGTSRVIDRLLDRREGNELYTVPLSDEFCDTSFRDLLAALLETDEQVLPIGFLRGEETFVNPPLAETFTKGDRLLLISAKRPAWSSIENAVLNAKR